MNLRRQWTICVQLTEVITWWDMACLRNTRYCGMERRRDALDVNMLERERAKAVGIAARGLKGGLEAHVYWKWRPSLYPECVSLSLATSIQERCFLSVSPGNKVQSLATAKWMWIKIAKWKTNLKFLQSRNWIIQQSSTCLVETKNHLQGRASTLCLFHEHTDSVCVREKRCLCVNPTASSRR